MYAHVTSCCHFDSVIQEHTREYQGGHFAVCVFPSKVPDFMNVSPVRQSALDATFYNKFNILGVLSTLLQISDISGSYSLEKRLSTFFFPLCGKASSYAF